MSQTLTCPKCGGTMQTYTRQGVQIEQCGSCRGIFLDHGELEHLSQMEARMMAPPPQAAPPAYPPQQYAQPGYPPAWGAPGYGHHKKSFGRMLFST